MQKHRAQKRVLRRGAVPDDQLYQLATQCGAATSYVDEVGDRRRVSNESLRQVLSVMGVAAQDSTQVTESIREIRSERWAEMLEPVLVVSIGRLPRTFSIRLPMTADHVKRVSFLWKVKKEQGGIVVGRNTGARATIINTTRLKDGAYCEIALPLPQALPLGYHSLTVDVRGPGINRRAVMILVVVPDQSYLHPAVKGSRRTWGLTIQLYGLRSAKNWGVGDFRDLREIVRWVGRELGADLLGVNPLHALPPGTISPYSPSSRLFHHPLYLDIEGISEFQELAPIQATVKASTFQAKLAALRRSQFVQYATIARMKQQILERLFLHFQRRHLTKNTSRARAFHRFVRHQGESLQRFALFRVLEEQMRGRRTLSETGPQGWRTWPTKYQHPDSPAVTKIAARYQSRLQLFQYIEWQCQQQLHAVQAAAKRAGMAIGLYKDMAVGIDPGGADSWAFQGQVVAQASIGTPPELFSPNGQRWNLSPFHPRQIKNDGYRPFTDCYRSIMQNCGIIRIDHAMGLFRLFWIPEGLEPAEGTYVRYPVDDLLGILALESVRHNVMIIGEDLGTVTTAIRNKLTGRGLLSYRLLPFEQTAPGRFARPSQFPQHAAAAVTTHDLPTLRGFWAGRDIELKSQLGLYPKTEWRKRDEETRARDKQSLLNALAKERLLPPGCPRKATVVPQLTEELFRAIYAYVARTPSRIMLISLEDLLGDLETPNIPGKHAYPSWQTKAGQSGSSWEDWKRLNRVRKLATVIHSERGRD